MSALPDCEARPARAMRVLASRPIIQGAIGKPRKHIFTDGLAHRAGKSRPNHPARAGSQRGNSCVPSCICALGGPPLPLPRRWGILRRCELTPEMFSSAITQFDKVSRGVTVRSASYLFGDLNGPGVLLHFVVWLGFTTSCRRTTERKLRGLGH